MPTSVSPEVLRQTPLKPRLHLQQYVSPDRASVQSETVTPLRFRVIFRSHEVAVQGHLKSLNCASCIFFFYSFRKYLSSSFEGAGPGSGPDDRSEQDCTAESGGESLRADVHSCLSASVAAFDLVDNLDTRPVNLFQGFSTSVLLTSGAGGSFVLGASLCIVGCLAIFLASDPLDTGGTPHSCAKSSPDIATFPGWSGVAKSPPVRNNSSVPYVRKFSCWWLIQCNQRILH